MTQESVALTGAHAGQGDEHGEKQNLLGPLLCWAVVFADIGTSVYYVPNLLYQSVQGLAAFFVFLTMSVFILLTLKYAEVTHRFPQGGGVVTVAAQAGNPWFGALGGMFILIDYFLTAAISSLAGIQYLSTVFPALAGSIRLPIVGETQALILIVAITLLVLLGILNWIGISESAKVSLVAALLAFGSNIAVLITVFSHISFQEFLSLFPRMFEHGNLGPAALMIGFAGSFLAFSGLESITQLAPVMKLPRKRVAGLALALVVITIGLTSPLLTLFSTTLLPDAMKDYHEAERIISLLAGNWGNQFLQIEVAISASALLIFACNTAIIGAYHVFMALSRMEFLPTLLEKRNKLRGTPHFSIILATGIPIIILIAVSGHIGLLGEMYAFGLLGAFSLTCLSLDIIRYRDIKRAKALQANPELLQKEQQAQERVQQTETTLIHTEVHASPREVSRLWYKVDFALGILTTILVIMAWSTNLVTKHLATAFGGGLTILGMAIAYAYYRVQQKEGKGPVPAAAHRVEAQPGSTMGILLQNSPYNNAVIQAAVNNADRHNPLTFLYITEHKPRETVPRMMEIVDPYLDDQQAKELFSKAEGQAMRARIPFRRYVYLQARPDLVTQIWQFAHPRDIILAAADEEQVKDINPDRVRYESTPAGKVVHLLKRW